jgi:hypothetical protein
MNNENWIMYFLTTLNNYASNESNLFEKEKISLLSAAIRRGIVAGSAERLGLFFDRSFDGASSGANQQYVFSGQNVLVRDRSFCDDLTSFLLRADLERFGGHRFDLSFFEVNDQIENFSFVFGVVGIDIHSKQLGNAYGHS